MKREGKNVDSTPSPHLLDPLACGLGKPVSNYSKDSRLVVKHDNLCCEQKHFLIDQLTSCFFYLFEINLNFVKNCLKTLFWRGEDLQV